MLPMTMLNTVCCWWYSRKEQEVFLVNPSHMASEGKTSVPY